MDQENALVRSKHGRITKLPSYLQALLFLVLSSCTVCAGVNIQARDDLSASEVKQGGDVTITATLADVPSDFANYKMDWSINRLSIHSVNDTREIRQGNRISRFNPSTYEATLTVEGATLASNGTYYFQLASDGVVIKSAPYTIIVLVPPSSVVIGGGDQQSLVESRVSNLTCTANGSNPEVQMRWLRNNVEVSVAVVMKHTFHVTYYVTTSYITITAEHAGNGDEYTCVVFGKQMAVEQNKVTTVSVQYSPKVTMSISPDFPHQVADKEVTFSCAADAQPAVSAWKWFLGDTELSETSGDLTYPSIPADMNGKKLKCQTTNSVGSGERVHTLNVHYGPKFITEPSDVEVDTGEPVTLICEIDGNPSPKVVWVKDDNANTVITSSTQLVIASVKETDFGAYRCVGTVSMDFANIESTAHILKKDIPQISGPTQFSFSQGQTAVLSCKAKCIPAPTEIIWRRGRSAEIIQVNSNSRYSIHQEKDVYGVTAVLTIQNLASNDFTNYNCTVVNERGRDSVILTLSQTDDFPWLWVVIGAVVFIVVATAIAVAVCCCCRKRKAKTSSAGSSVGSINPYWTDARDLPPHVRYTPSEALNFYKTCSLSVVSNTTDNSIKKPADGMEQEELSSLPEYGMRPIDTWRTNPDHTPHTAFDSLDYPTNEQKPELYGSFRSSPCTTFNPPQAAFPPGNYGSYRVQHPRLEIPSNTAPQYSTLPIRPSMLPPNEFDRRFACSSNNYINESFPEPPAEHRLATNV